MNFQELYDQIGKLAPEQRQQEIVFVKHGASTGYNWDGIAQDDFFEDSERLSLEIANDGSIYKLSGEDNMGIPDCDYGTLEETLYEDDTIAETVPDGMPYFCISPSNDEFIQ